MQSNDKFSGLNILARQMALSCFLWCWTGPLIMGIGLGVRNNEPEVFFLLFMIGSIMAFFISLAHSAIVLMPLLWSLRSFGKTETARELFLRGAMVYLFSLVVLLLALTEGDYDDIWETDVMLFWIPLLLHALWVYGYAIRRFMARV